MPFQVDDQVVYPAFGVGRIVGLVTKTFLESEGRLYCEISGERSTVWVQVEGGAAHGLRRLTRKDELAHFRAVLRSRPLVLNPDFRQRQLDVRSQLRPGTLQGLCEVVRDLSGRSWLKPLNEADSATLRSSTDSLCREWAAADTVSIGQATTELNTLLLEARRAYQV
jgi:RNA polymerase-interacting CarD/CdnL/TRCF family regulator